MATTLEVGACPVCGQAHRYEVAIYASEAAAAAGGGGNIGVLAERPGGSGSDAATVALVAAVIAAIVRAIGSALPDWLLGALGVWSGRGEEDGDPLERRDVAFCPVKERYFRVGYRLEGVRGRVASTAVRLEG